MGVVRQIVSILSRRTLIILISIVFLFFIILGLQTQINQLNYRKNELENPRHSNANGNEINPLKYQSNFNDRPIVLYNRIPKTGSTSFTQQVYAMTKRNKIYVAHVNTTKNSFRMSLPDQYDIVWNISKWHEEQPAFYHGHFGYISFPRFGARDPLYINLLREPLDRLVSYYYFLRYGDDFRKGLKRVKQGDKTTFDECVARQGRDCQAQKMWMQIPLLCGQIAECWIPGSQWALDEAKKNLQSKYMLVGVTEQMEDFIFVLEATVPSMFSGMTESYREGKKSYVRKTLHKDPPSNETIAKLKNTKVYRMERELYDTAVKQFAFLKQLTISKGENGISRRIPKQYRYEKMYGPNGLIIK